MERSSLPAYGTPGSLQERVTYSHVQMKLLTVISECEGCSFTDVFNEVDAFDAVDNGTTLLIDFAVFCELSGERSFGGLVGAFRFTAALARVGFGFAFAACARVCEPVRLLFCLGCFVAGCSSMGLKW